MFLDSTELNHAVAQACEIEARDDKYTGLVHANRVAMIGYLAASIVHDVKQPIAAMVANAQAALHFLDRLDVDEVREALDCIVRDGERAAALVDRTRDLAKRRPRRRDRVDVNVTIHETIELIRTEAITNRVSVRTELLDTLPTVQGDRVELQQAVLNLIINAIEAMSGMNEGPRELIVSGDRTEAGGVLISVRDSGPGLTRSIQENLFESFHTTKPNGLGLGLSISRSIIEQHGGRLWASANAPRGAVFQFALPSSSHRASLNEQAAAEP
ncbi:MAG TPA: ATP-binding protein [Roseiarcus sp.]|jgi:C4-dicarboxylate-specific signal transduction histidine kinase